MSPGFLSRLVRRARGAESSLRPLVPPLFAPPASPEQGTHLVEEAANPPPESSPAPHAQRPLAPQADADLLPTQMPAQPLTPASPTQPAAQVSPQRPTFQERAPSPPLGLPTRPAQPVDIPLPAITIRQPTSAIDEPSTEAAPRRAAPPATPPPVNAQVEPPRAGPRPESLLLPVQPPQTALLTARPKPGSKDTPSKEREVAAPPAVRINIGRVEVRAIQPPAPPNPSNRAEPHPGLSLDEYLRRLNEENR